MKSALLSCFLLFSLLVQSQSWCPVGAQWAYRLQCPEMNTHANIWLEKDTIIDSQPCKKIAGIETYLSSRVPVVYYTYESNDTVFFYYQGDFWPTYFFNAALFLFANCPQAASMSFPLLLLTFTIRRYLSSKNRANSSVFFASAF